MLQNIYKFGISIINLLPISGFDFPDCDPIKADSVRQTVSWNGNPNVGSLAGKVVRLKFQMQNTKLYALKFDEAAR